MPPNTNNTEFITTATNSSGFTPAGNNNTQPENYSFNGFLIAIEVIFTVIVLFILAFCFYAGIRKKKRVQKENEKRIETAIYQQEHKFLLHLEGRCHSSSTITSATLLPPPPRYTPPNPKYNLPKEALTRLDCLLSHNQICTTIIPPSNSITLPKYTSSSSQLYY